MDATTIIIIVVISLAVGFFTGRLMGEYRGESKESKEENPDPGVLVVKRDTRNGKTSVRLGRWFYSGKGILDDFTKSELNSLSKDLKTWLGETAEIASVEKSGDIQMRDAFTAGNMHLEIESAEGESTKIGASGFLTRALSADIKSPDLKPKSVAAQVDEILQDKIAGTSLATRGIRLMEFPNGGLVVMVGMEKYNSVDEVPDAAIRSAIKEAVSTWEDRMLEND